MKLKVHYIILLALVLGTVSCKKDNYEAPSVSLKGRLLYNGEEVGVEHNQVKLELYQSGFGKVGAIESTFAQDGTYSQILFDGQYKLLIPNGQGPFRWRENAAGSRDSLAVSLNGAQTLDLEVIPYYMVRNAVYTKTGTTLTSTFRIDKIITDANAKNIEYVALYVNKTQFVSATDQIASSGNVIGADILDPANMTLTATIPSITPTQNYVFARVGVKIVDVEDMVFSPLKKIEF